MQHLDEGILQAWLDRPRSGLDPSESADIERHLEACERCAAALEALRSTDDRTHALLTTGVDRDMPRPPFEEVVRRARGGGRTGGTRLRLNRMAWAASIVVALGVGWMTNEMVRSGAVPVGESVQPGSSRVFEAEQAPAEAPSASAPTADADAAARQAEPIVDAAGEPSAAQESVVADANPNAVDDVAGVGATARSAPEPAAVVPGRADVAPERAAPPAADQIAPLERREADEASALADLAGDELAVVSGVVRTVDGDPVGAAQVYVERLAVGTLSDVDGSYTLLVPRSELDSARLNVVVERIGFRAETRRVSVAGPEPVVADFGLQDEAIQLQEVVVTGTAGATQRRALGNAVTTLEAVTVDALEWSPVGLPDVEARLGRAPVTSPALDVLSWEVAPDGPDGAPLVRVRQSLGDGSVLTLVQGAAQPDRDAWPVTSDGAVESTRVGELLVTATAPVSASFLRTLLAGLS